jgi:hypothetical protein
MTTKPMFVLAAALLGGACGARATKTERADTLPKALVDLEAASEHGYDRALAGDTAAVVEDADRVLDDWTHLRGEVHRRGAASDVLGEVDEAVLAFGNVARSSTDAVVVARAANRITGSMDELFALYDPGVRADLMDLDYLGRALSLDGRAADLRHAGTHLSLLDTRWAELRPEIEQLGNADEFGKLEAAIGATRVAVASLDAETITTRANDLVDRVYDVESAFH